RMTSASSPVPLQREAATAAVEPAADARALVGLVASEVQDQADPRRGERRAVARERHGAERVEPARVLVVAIGVVLARGRRELGALARREDVEHRADAG